MNKDINFLNKKKTRSEKIFMRQKTKRIFLNQK